MSNATPPRQWPPVGQAPATYSPPSSSSQRPSTPDFWWNPRTGSVYVAKIPDSDSNLAIASLGNPSVNNGRIEISKASHTGKDAGPSKHKIESSNRLETTNHVNVKSDTIVTRTHPSVPIHAQKAAPTKNRKVGGKSQSATSLHTSLRYPSGQGRGTHLAVTSSRKLGPFNWEKNTPPTNSSNHNLPSKR